TYQFFTSEINQRTRARALLGADLRRALEREEFTLAYQPKFDLLTMRPCGGEALLRWTHPERGPVPPAQFVHVLEESGLIVRVGPVAGGGRRLRPGGRGPARARRRRPQGLPRRERAAGADRGQPLRAAIPPARPRRAHPRADRRGWRLARADRARDHREPPDA